MPVTICCRLAHQLTNLEKLQRGAEHIIKWFLNNILKSNACAIETNSVCHLITRSKTGMEIVISNFSIKNEERVRPLGIYIDINV